MNARVIVHPCPPTKPLETAALFNLHNRSIIEVSGPDARTFLHNLSTNDIKTLPVGETREAFLTTMKARVHAHVWIANPKPDMFVVDFVAGQSEKILKHLDRHIISEQVDLADRTNDLAFFRVVGPKAVALVESIGLTPLRRHRLLALDGCDVRSRQGPESSQKLLDAKRFWATAYAPASSRLARYANIDGSCHGVNRKTIRRRAAISAGNHRHGACGK